MLNENLLNKTISIVIPTYNEEENIYYVYETLNQLFKEKLPYYMMSIIFADNFSSDQTRELIREICRKDNRVGAIFNSTNVGYARSSYYAMTQADGDAVILLSADLQEPPEIIPTFIAEWEKGSKIVCGIKSQSKESKLLYFMRQRYYDFLKSSSDTGHINQFNGYALYDASFINVLRKIEDPLPYLRGIVAELAPKVSYVEYTQNKRNYGKTHYNFWGLYNFAMHGITSSSKGILRVATIMGFLLAIVCIIVALITFITKLICWGDFELGVAALTTGLFFLGSVLLFYLGLIGEYIVNINTRIMKHPLVVEEERINIRATENKENNKR